MTDTINSLLLEASSPETTANRLAELFDIATANKEINPTLTESLKVRLCSNPNISLPIFLYLVQTHAENIIYNPLWDLFFLEEPETIEYVLFALHNSEYPWLARSRAVRDKVLGKPLRVYYFHGFLQRLQYEAAQSCKKAGGGLVNDNCSAKELHDLWPQVLVQYQHDLWAFSRRPCAKGEIPEEYHRMRLHHLIREELNKVLEYNEWAQSFHIPPIPALTEIERHPWIYG